MMDPETTALPPPQQLAVAYARSDFREAWSLLLEFDNRMMAIAFKGQEPVLKQMRLAWWREQLAKSVADRPKGEPLLARLSRMPNAGQVEVAAATLIDAWEELITDDGDTGAGLQKCADLRADAIFASYAGWVGSNVTAATEAGRTWAVADLGGGPQPPRKKLSGQLRPLNLLLFASAVEQSDSGFARLRTIVRLYLHALTGL
jgi:phytoene synthase